MHGAPSPASDRVYADHAAGSFPKPASVVEAIAAAAARLHSAGRGGYRESLEAGDLVASCRHRLAALLNASRDEEIAFTAGTTDSINLVVKGVARRAGRLTGAAHVVATTLDHNAVLRPLHSLEVEGVTHTLVSPRGDAVDPIDLAAAIRPETCLVVVNHVSNVTGAIQPAAEIAKACRERGVFCLVDAAQSAGHLPIDVKLIGCDALAVPAHKGLLGPQGIGAIWIRGGAEERIDPWRDGGTGVRSEERAQPSEMPMRFESGTTNLLGVAGLDAGVRHLERLPGGVAEVAARERRLSSRMLEAFRTTLASYALIGPRDAMRRTAVFSFRHPRLSCTEVAAILESEFGILCRAGLACAPLAGGDGQGWVRCSFGLSSSMHDVERVVEALEALRGV
jgi:cysteine desulfurase / selenocysteine lyase